MNKKAIYLRKELRGRMHDWLFVEENFTDEYHLRHTLFNKSYLRKFRRVLREANMRARMRNDNKCIVDNNKCIVDNNKRLRGIKERKDPYYYLLLK